MSVCTHNFLELNEFSKTIKSYNDAQVLFKKASVVCDKEHLLGTEVLQAELRSRTNVWDTVFIASKQTQGS